MGCSPGDDCPVEKVTAFACPILKCATGTGIPFCARDCVEYPCTLYQRGLPTCDLSKESQPQTSSDQIPSAWPKFGLRMSGPGRASDSSGIRPQLHIFCLGPLRVYQSGKLVTEADWGQSRGPTQKVKALFAYLLAKAAHGATKDEIVELLWGEQPADGSKNDARLHTTLYCLRRALEPNLLPRAESQYVVHHEGLYVLAPPGGYWSDAAAFEDYCKHALRLDTAGQVDAAAHYRKLAEALYQGDYMSGLLPCYTEEYVNDCCQWRRYQLKAMYQTLLLRLAQHHFDAGQDRLSLAYAQKTLVEDRCSEEAHRLVMILMHRAGHHNELVQQYHLCELSLAEAEDRGPSPETIQLYQQLLQTSHTNYP